MAIKTNFTTFNAKHISVIENITYNYAFRRIKVIKKQLNITANRHFLTLIEVQQYYQFNESDIDVILSKFKT